MKKEETFEQEESKKKKTENVNEDARDYYEAESWQFSSCGD